MKTVQIIDDEVDILEDLILCTLEDEESSDVLFPEQEEYIKELKQLYNKIVTDRFKVEK